VRQRLLDRHPLGGRHQLVAAQYRAQQTLDHMPTTPTRILPESNLYL
jgi:hypothetical protein